MTSLFRKFKWWLERRRREDDLREELEFHLSEEAGDRQAEGLTVEQARQAALRDLGNLTLVREDARRVWTWTVVEQLAQDVRYALRMMLRNPAFSALAVLSLALGIGANTAIYSFMDSILLRSLPVSDPASLAVVKWRSGPVNFGAPDGSGHVLHSIDGSTYRDGGGTSAAIFPYPAFERLQQVSGPVFSSLFAYYPAETLNVMIHGQAELAKGHYVSGEFFHGLAVSPAAGRPLVADDDRAGAAPVVVISTGYGERRFGDAAERDRPADPDQQRRLHRRRRRAAGVLRRRSGAAPSLYFRCTPVAFSTQREPEAGRRSELLLARDDGTPASRRQPRTGADCARRSLRAMGGLDGDEPRELANLPVLRLEKAPGDSTRCAGSTRSRSTCCS